MIPVRKLEYVHTPAQLMTFGLNPSAVKAAVLGIEKLLDEQIRDAQSRPPAPTVPLVTSIRPDQFKASSQELFVAAREIIYKYAKDGGFEASLNFSTSRSGSGASISILQPNATTTLLQTSSPPWDKIIETVTPDMVR